MPFCLGVGLLCAIERPSVAGGGTRLLDVSLLACLGAVGAQIVPLPVSARQALSPGSFEIDRVLHFPIVNGPPVLALQTLSIDADSTAWAFALALSYIGLFWCARQLFARGGIRMMARAVAWMGLALAAVAIVQHATAPDRLYWYWRPISAGATPYGPFVNRNSFATWLVMAIPLVVGYALTRRQSRGLQARGFAARLTTIDAVDLWLAASACLMMGGLLGSLSRAGIIGGAAGLVTFVWLSKIHVSKGHRIIGVAAALGAMIAIATMYANMGALTVRMNRALELGVAGRRAIWSDTWQMAGDFWLTGVGTGAYERGMLVYQQGSREFFYNHAHNEYLQMLAEGGALLAVPVAVALVAGVRLVARRLRADRSPLFWLRAGAASGIIAVAVQSIWDTGLRVPANDALFAVMAAIATYDAVRIDRSAT
ncbi:MAG: O-antigen ligase family protein [Vicinamibacterales bacterium]